MNMMANRFSVSPSLKVGQETPSDYEASKLQFFIDHQTKQVSGFGWLNENKFCYGSYAGISNRNDLILK